MIILYTSSFFNIIVYRSAMFNILIIVALSAILAGQVCIILYNGHNVYQL